MVAVNDPKGQTVDSVFGIMEKVIAGLDGDSASPRAMDLLILEHTTKETVREANIARLALMLAFFENTLEFQLMMAQYIVRDRHDDLAALIEKKG